MKLLITTQAVDINHPILGFFIGWIQEFAKHFDEVHVICLQKGEYDLPPHVHIYSLGKEERENRLKYTLRFYKYFWHIFFSVHVDYVFFHMGAIYNILAAPFFFLRKFFHTKFYWWKAHGHIDLIGRIALIFTDAVYTSTESGFSIPTKKRKIVGQAIDTTLFVLPRDHTQRKQEIIFVGRIMPIKRIENFIATAEILRVKYPSLIFKIFGPIGNDLYYRTLQRQIVSADLEHVVSFLGSKTQKELIDVYQSARIFLNTSRTESMDKTVLEAVLSGCIPVTANKAFTDLLQHKGLYTENADPEQYANIIETLLSTDNSLLQTQLRGEVEKLHSLSTFSHRIFNI